MEEKERYRDREVSTETDYYTSIYDTEENIDFFEEDIIPLLNQQDKCIKELEKENGYIIFVDGYDENGNEIHRQEFVKYKDKFPELVAENRHLKEEVIYQKNYGIEAYAISMLLNDFIEFVCECKGSKIGVGDFLIEKFIAERCKYGEM